MAAWSPEIANEFIRRAAAQGKALTQMQLQKLVYIANGWNLAIHGEPLTEDEPEAWEYGPVYRQLRNALKEYGSAKVSREIQNSEFLPGRFAENPDTPATASLSPEESELLDKVFEIYGKFHAFQLSALTHKPDTPWSKVYGNGEGKSRAIPASLIREHFVHLAATRRAG